MALFLPEFRESESRNDRQDPFRERPSQIRGSVYLPHNIKWSFKKDPAQSEAVSTSERKWKDWVEVEVVCQECSASCEKPLDYRRH